MTTMSNKRKKAVAAVVAAAAILLAGTFAWTSISQIALNESAGIVNVGGRLHDDFNGENKDVYVENFTDPLNGGQPIYARVRLDEYMEVGQDAGGYGADVDKDGTVEAVPVVAGTDINDVDTWTTHIPTESCTVCQAGETCKIHDHWTWDMGGQTTYMPTFNKDKDSLKAEINGTYEGTTKGDTVYYDDYIAYTEGQTLDGSASYDDDTNTVDDGNVWTQGETHTAKKTTEGTVIMMKDWDGTPGNYWVYDTDGWAYWANPIMPGEATGLFLSSIDMKKNPGEKCYYGINVVGQFATVSDWEYFEEGGEPTPEALEVLAAASANVPKVTVLPAGTNVTLGRTQSYDFDAEVTMNEEVKDSGITWSVVDASGAPIDSSTTIDKNGNLTVGDDEMRQILVVVAKSDDYPGAVGLKPVNVNIYQVTVSEKNETIKTPAGKYLYFSADVTLNGEDVESEVNWSVTAGNNVTINGDGRLWIPASIDDGVILTVTAASKKDTTATASYQVEIENNYEITVTASGSPKTVNAGGTQQFSASAKRNGSSYSTEVEWAVEGGSGTTAIDETGLLSVDSNEAHQKTLTVKASIPGKDNAVGTYEIDVYEGYAALKLASEGDQVVIDNTAWWVVKKESDQAMIWSVESVGSYVFDTEEGATGLVASDGDKQYNVWRDADLRTTLNSTYLNSLTKLSGVAKATTIYTAPNISHNGDFIDTEDKVFLLSEADLCGMVNSGGNWKADATDSKEYTLNSVGILVTEEMKSSGNTLLRSPHYYGSYGDNEWLAKWIGNSMNRDNPTTRQPIRPAMWVDLTK